MTIADSVAASVSRKPLEDRTKNLWQERTEDWFRRESEDLGGSVPERQIRDTAQRHAREWAVNRLQTITETTRKRMAKQIGIGIRKGESPKEIADRLQKHWKSLTPARAETIAHTEVLRSSSFASHKAQQYAGVKRRVWTTQRDGNVRDSHTSMDGQVRGINQNFVSGLGNSLPFPGWGPAADSVNCRCRVIPFRALESRSQRDAVWKEAEGRALGWELEVEPLLRAGLEEQIDTAMSLLRKS